MRWSYRQLSVIGGEHVTSHIPTSHFSVEPRSIGGAKWVIRAAIVLSEYSVCEALLNNVTV
jgi:hypothetical protein